MEIKNLGEIFIGDSTIGFLVEILFRTIVMFALVLLVLRISGRRGVRQLTIFDVAIILGLGSAAGDPMFQEDIPIVHGLMVFVAVILFYRGVTWLASKFYGVHRLMEGEPMVIVRAGEFTVNETKLTNFSQMEFFSELRNESIEHLGQVRVAVLETDGSLSVLRYNDQDARFGLPLFPDDYQRVDPRHIQAPVACMRCGRVVSAVRDDEQTCNKCGGKHWAKAKKTALHGA